MLKATYLADQETLLEETRATALYYFPGPVVWLLIWGVLAYLVGALVYSWPGQSDALGSFFSSIANTIHFAALRVERDTFYLTLVLLLIGVLWFLVRYLRWISTVYAVTNRRVIIQRGILGRDFDEIPVLQVRGVDVHQSVGQRLLGYGTVRVSSEGTGHLGNEDWKGIPRPFKFQKLIEDAVATLESGVPVTAGASPVMRR